MRKSSCAASVLIVAVLLTAMVSHAQMGTLPVPGKSFTVTVLGRAECAAEACEIAVQLEATADSLADIHRQLEGTQARCVQAAKDCGVPANAIAIEGPDFTGAQIPGIFGNIGMFLQPPGGGGPAGKPAYRGTLSIRLLVPFNVGDMENSLDRIQKVVEAMKKATNRPVMVTFVARDMQALHDKAFQDGFAKASSIAQKLAAAAGKRLGTVEGVVFADMKEIMGQVMGGMFRGGLMGQMLGLTPAREGSTNPRCVVVEETLTFSFQVID